MRDSAQPRAASLQAPLVCTYKKPLRDDIVLRFVVHVDAEEESRALGYKGRWTFLVAFLVVGLVILVNEAIVSL